MQDYFSACKIVSAFFENPNLASIVHSYMTPQFHVAQVYENYGKTADGECLGVFSTEVAAVKAILDHLDKSCLLADYDEMDLVELTKREYFSLLANIKSSNQLERFCTEWADGSYQNRWNFKIELLEALS